MRPAAPEGLLRPVPELTHLNRKLNPRRFAAYSAAGFPTQLLSAEESVKVRQRPFSWLGWVGVVVSHDRPPSAARRASEYDHADRAPDASRGQSTIRPA